MTPVPPIILTYGVRSEPQWLVDQLRENCAWVDGFAEVDNRHQRGGWAHEGEFKRAQRNAVLQASGGAAAWALFLDPDERLERSAAEVIRRVVMSAPSGLAIGFPLREMWTPTAYRIDGPWAAKKPRRRMYLLDPGLPKSAFPHKPIHCGVVPKTITRRVTLEAVRLYHLKNIEPRNRVERADAYYAADPAFQHQRPESRRLGRAGWNWVHDEEGLELREIEAGREFTPAYDRAYRFEAPV